MQLQKAPSGILGWFALKVGGYNPPAFSDAVIPVVEVGDNYLATSELQVKTQNLATTLATFNGNDFTVPNGKCWRLIGASIFGSLNAADTALKTVISIGIKTPISSPAACLLGLTESGSGVVTRGHAIALRPPVFLPSGFIVSLGMATNTAITVTSNFSCNVLIQEFDL